MHLTRPSGLEAITDENPGHERVGGALFVHDRAVGGVANEAAVSDHACDVSVLGHCVTDAEGQADILEAGFGIVFPIAAAERLSCIDAEE